MTLQSEEIISEECRKKNSQTQPGVHSHLELKESSLFIKKTDLTLQIPVHITPTFVTDISKLISLVVLMFMFQSFFKSHFQISSRIYLVNPQQNVYICIYLKSASRDLDNYIKI